MSLNELRAAIDRLTAEKIALARDLIKLQSELIRRNRMPNRKKFNPEE